MEEKRKVILTQLAHEHISDIYRYTLEDELGDEEELMDDFLDVVFDEVPKFPERFPACEGIKSGSHSYRIAPMYGGYRVIYQIFREKVLILLILHESELPF